MRCLLVVFVAILLAAAGLIPVDSPVEGGGWRLCQQVRRG
jgi:hypothetical protein